MSLKTMNEEMNEGMLTKTNRALLEAWSTTTRQNMGLQYAIEKWREEMNKNPCSEVDMSNTRCDLSSTEFTTDDPSKIGTGAIKYDGGKVPIYQGFIKYFPRAIEAVARVSAFGAQKYAWDGWEDVEDGFNRYMNAKCRHQIDAAKGEECASDSKLLHLEHEAWGAMATLELYLREKERG